MKLGILLLTIFATSHALYASEDDVSTLDFFDSSSPPLGAKDIENCSRIWELLESQGPTQDRIGNPYELLSKTSLVGQRFQFDRQVDGAWVRLVPASTREVTARIRGCKRCEIQVIECQVPTAWKALDTAIQPQFAPELQNANRCLLGSDRHCLTRVNALGGLSFTYDATVLPESARPYGYLSWVLSPIREELASIRARRVREAFRLDPRQSLQMQSILGWVDPHVNNFVRQIQLRPTRSNQLLPSIVIGTSRSKELVAWGKNHVALPRTSVIPSSQQKGRSQEYFRELMEATNSGAGIVPSFALLDTTEMTAQGERFCSRESTLQSQSCRAQSVYSLYQALIDSQKEGKAIQVDLITGGKSAESDQSAFFRFQFIISETGTVELQSSSLVTPDEYSNYMGIIR